jgi:hypothetical protein
MLKRLASDLEVEYIFGRLTEHTDQMISMFNDEEGGQYIKVADMKDISGMVKTIISVTSGSMGRTASTLKTGRKKKLILLKPVAGADALASIQEDDWVSPV